MTEQTVWVAHPKVRKFHVPHPDRQRWAVCGKRIENGLLIDRPTALVQGIPACLACRRISEAHDDSTPQGLGGPDVSLPQGGTPSGSPAPDALPDTDTNSAGAAAEREETRGGAERPGQGGDAPTAGDPTSGPDKAEQHAAERHPTSETLTVLVGLMDELGQVYPSVVRTADRIRASGEAANSMEWSWLAETAEKVASAAREIEALADRQERQLAGADL